MKYKERLINLLCEVDDIKKDLTGKYEIEYVITGDIHNNFEEQKKTLSLIGKPLEERHIRMYCDDNNKCEKCGHKLILADGTCEGCTGNNRIDQCGCGMYLVCSNECGEKEGGTDKPIDSLLSYSDLIYLLEEEKLLDNTKSFNNQSEKTYREIFNFLKEKGFFEVKDLDGAF